MNKKGKKEKILKDREEGGEVRKWRDKGGLPWTYTGRGTADRTSRSHF